jgi:hypothetical protein
MRVLQIITVSLALAGGAALSPASVSALPLSPAAGGAELTAQLNQSSSLIDVRYRRGGGRGFGVGAGLATGLLLGGMIASHPSYYYPGYPPYPYYSPAYPAYGPYPAGDPAIAYCLRRFRSYDPYSMTYLGNDGYRHPCP